MRYAPSDPLCRMVGVYVILSCAVSLDGYIDDATEHRLVLSDAADFDRVDELRAGCDAILVGANTVRNDNPRLLVRSPTRRAARVAAGRPPTPIKVTLTASGALNPAAAFFTADTTDRGGTHEDTKLVYCPPERLAAISARFASVATVAPAANLAELLADLSRRGVRRLLVEGGTSVLTAFLAAGLADELWLAVAPVLVGDTGGARFLAPAAYPPGRLRLADSAVVGDMAVLHYLVPHDG